MKTNTFLFLVLIFTYFCMCIPTHGQRSLKLGISYGTVTEQSSYHAGMSINTGLEFTSRSERIRFTPIFSIGYHNGTEMIFPDVPLSPLQVWPIQVETPVYFDLFRNATNSFNWFFGLGVYGNLALGSYLLGSIGGYTGTGFRISPEDVPFSIEVVPFNYMVGCSRYSNLFGRMSIIFFL